MVDPALFLDPFLKYLLSGAKILDVGCGSGRDLLWFKKKGFDPLGLERSPGLAALARRHSGCRVLTGDFETFDFSGLEVDALLMSGSLVHLPPAKLSAVLSRILSACRLGAATLRASRPLSTGPRKHVYISLKEGRGTKRFTDGRLFYLWEQESALSILERQGLNILEVRRNVSVLRPDDTWLAFVAAF